MALNIFDGAHIVVGTGISVGCVCFISVFYV
jgi:hypothetical protein